MPSRLLADKLYNAVTYYQPCPEGDLNVTFVEDDDKLLEIIVTIGKAGSSVAAWASVTQDFINYLLQEKVELTKIMSVLSEVRTGKFVQGVNGVKCYSGPEAMYICFIKYNNDKTREALDKLPISYNESLEGFSEP